MKIFSYFFPQIIVEIYSSYNGKIRVIESFGKRMIEIGGLQQSGPLIEKNFQNVFTKLIDHRFIQNIKSVLILGLGGGTALKILKQKNLKLQITAVEIDRTVVDVGRKYLGLDLSDTNIIYGDVFKVIDSINKKYDLIIVDLFQGYYVPKELFDEVFLEELKSRLSKKGLVIFNRLYFQSYKNEADIFLDKVKKIFQDVTKEKIYYNIFIKAK
jgi:spermidine synthase